MEIKGRECEEVKIGDDTLYLLSSFKGKEYRKIMEVQFGEDTKIGMNGEVEFNAGRLLAGVPDLFPIFCVDIVRGEQHLQPNTEYLDNLDVEDYVKIQEILTNKMSDVANAKKA